MRRREFLSVLVAVAVWPHLARGQQTDRVWRVGALNALAETDLSAQAWDAAFRKRLDELGLIDGRNIHIDYRWAAGSIDRIKLFAKELIRLDPDVLVAVTTPATAALQTETRTIPIIFANVSDPVGSGFVLPPTILGISPARRAAPPVALRRRSPPVSGRCRSAPISAVRCARRRITAASTPISRR
jgi:ABC-type uncharacterized transport system substrate-binding protein